MSAFRRVACTVLALSAFASAAAAEEYPFDMPKRRPAAMKAWQAVVPKEFRKQAWIYHFDGTAGPLSEVTLHERTFLYGSVCIPHDCGGNFVAVLAAEDGSEAFGELSSETLKVNARYFGSPDAEARGLLDKALTQ